MVKVPDILLQALSTLFSLALNQIREEVRTLSPSSLAMISYPALTAARATNEGAVEKMALLA